jgi:hypothetical protein
MRGVTSAVTHRIHSVAVLYSSKRRHYDRYVAEHSRLSIERRRAGVQACSLRRDATFEGRQRVYLQGQVLSIFVVHSSTAQYPMQTFSLLQHSTLH